MRYIENSPIFMADRVKTPVLMIHNDADDAVPWYQGIEFYLALRRLEKEVYFFNYNGEGHGLRKRENQKDYTVRLQEFFDHYLKGAPMPAWMREGRRYVDKKHHPRQRRRPAISRVWRYGASAGGLRQSVSRVRTPGDSSRERRGRRRRSAASSREAS